MSHRRRIVLAAALAGTLAVPLVAAARRPAAPPSPSALLERAALRLELTPEQKEEIRAILLDHRAEVEAELLVLRGARQRLWDAIHAESPQDAAIRNAAAAVGRAEGELGVTRAAVVEQVRAVLTAEQQAELQEMAGDARAFVVALLERLRDHVEGVFGG